MLTPASPDSSAIVETETKEMPASPDFCRVAGFGEMHTVGTMAEFNIEACDKEGKRKHNGGDAFFIAIRGASRVRGRVNDNKDGTYTLSWRPVVSGQYSIVVSLFGYSIAGSPFTALVNDPSPFAPLCEVNGTALNYITARTSSTFMIRYRDRCGNVAQAVELDVFVVPVGSDPTDSAAWKLATQGEQAPVSEGGLTEEQKLALLEEEKKKMSALADAEGKGKKGKKAAKERRGSVSAAAAPAAAPAPAPPPPLPPAPPPMPPLDDDPYYDSADDEGGGAYTGGSAGGDGTGPVDDHFVASADETRTVRRRAIRVQVGDRPLILRSGFDLNSAQVGEIKPGQVVTVVEERITSANVRACIATEDTAPQLPLSARLSPGSEVEGGSSSVSGSGWVTLKKNGKKLVSSRLRLEPMERQAYMQQWKRRQFNDKLQRGVKSEIENDATGIAFAFGGVHPGWLHSKGQLRDEHQVSYSVGKVGQYLLHVRLRQQALAVTGSPFALTVTPGPAHASATSIEPDQVPLVGVVGMQEAEGVRLTMQAADQMGNICTKGGADVKTSCGSTGVEAYVDDLGDGTYLMRWQSKVSGMYEAKVTINNVTVVNSPCKFKLTSNSPELPKSQIEGEGLKHAVAGEPAAFTILFYDTFGNLATQSDPSFKIKLAVTHERRKVQDLKEHPFEGTWSAENEGEYKITYIAKFAGHEDLHVWCDPYDRGERIVLPGSPFNLHVTSGVPSAQESSVESWSIEHRTEKEKGGTHKKKPAPSGADEGADDGLLRIVAGDSICVKPQILDVFKNATKLSDGQLTGMVLAPDGSETNLNVTQQTKASVVTYEVRYETLRHGKHELHVLLGGEPVVGSPILFQVIANAAEPATTKLLLPENADALEADYDHPSVVTLKTYDKYGNPCSTGGLLATGRLSLIKKDAADQTLLMPNNHSVTIEDMHDGTYAIRVAIKMAATVKLIVNMDKNMPAGAGELPPAQLNFIEKGKGATADSAPPSGGGAGPNVVRPPASSSHKKDRDGRMSSEAGLDAPPSETSPEMLASVPEEADPDVAAAPAPAVPLVEEAPTTPVQEEPAPAAAELVPTEQPP